MSSSRLRVLLSGAALALTAGAVQAETLVVSWWGFNGEKLEANVVKPFQELCGCELVFETGNNGDRLNKVAARGGVGVDVIFLADAFSQQGIDQGLFLEIDQSKLTNIDALHELAKDPQGGYGPAYTIGRAGIVYDEAKVEPITSWSDLWREDLKAAVTLPGITTTAGPMVVVRAGAKAGVDAFTEEDTAFEMVEALKPNVVKNYNTGSEMVNLFSTGEVAVAVAQDFTMGQLKAAVPTLVWATLDEGDIATVNTLNIPKGSTKVDLAYQFIDFMLSKDVQQIQAEEAVDAPVRKDVELTPEQAEIWTFGEDVISKLQLVDYKAMVAKKAGWVDRWNEVFGM